MKQKISLPLYRLTLSEPALRALAPRLRYMHLGMVRRLDNRLDVPISFALLDQLKTVALPKENLSDTVLRITKGLAQ